MKIRGEWLVIAAAMLWGTTGTTQALAPPSATPIAIGTLRLIVGTLGLAIIATWRGSFCYSDPLPRTPLWIAAIAIGMYQLLFFAGVNLAGVAIGTIVGIGSAPILAGFMGWLIREETLSIRWLAATALGIVGCTLLLLPDQAVRVNVAGILLATSAGAAYAIYTLGSKRLMRSHAPETVTVIVFSLASLMVTPLLFVNSLAWILTPQGALVVLHLGLVTVTLGYILFARGLNSVTAATAVTLTLTEPLTAGVLGVVVVGERLGLVALAGIALIFTGLLLLTVKKRAS